MSDEPAAGESFELEAADGRRFRWHCRAPAGPVRGVVQVLHGMAEHYGRYERFAAAFVERGYACAIHGHRGHDDSVAGETPLWFADRDGWDRVVGDALLVQAAARERFPGLPLVLFGHSMGSYVAQATVMRAPGDVAALALSGSNAQPWLPLAAGRLVAGILRRRYGARSPSAALNAQAFGAFNRRFAPARTDFDWLSRDTAEVDRYVADPRCGGIATTGFWCDFLDGLLSIHGRRALARIPADLPILITGGSDDPVGGRAGMTRLADRYEDSGHGNVTLRVFDGGRHEMLNETNRGEFTGFVIDWVDGIVGGG